MKKKLGITFILFSIPTVLLFFQNCGRPSMPSTNSSSSVEYEPYDPDTSPNLVRDDNGTPIEIENGKVVYSSARKAGTNQHESTWSLTNTSDGGYMTTGIRDSDPSLPDNGNTLFQKFDEAGELLYSVEIGDTNDNQSYRAIELPSTYLVVGVTRTLLEGDGNRKADAMLYQLNKVDGKLVYAKRIGNNNFQQITDVIYVNDYNPYIMAIGKFYENVEEEHSGLLMKLDLSLTTLWEKKYTLPGHQIDLRSIARAPGKGIYVVGSIKAEAANHGDALIMRFNESGYLLSSRRVKSSPNHNDFFSDIANTGGKLITFGLMAGNGFNTDGSVMFFDYDLNFQKAYMVGNNSKPSYFNSGKATRDGGLILSGKYLHTVDSVDSWYNWIVKLDKNFAIEFTKGYGMNHHNYQYYMHPLTIRKDLGYAFVVNVMENNTSISMDPYLLLVNNLGEIPPTCGLKSIFLPSDVKIKTIEFDNVLLNEGVLSLGFDDIFGEEEDFREMDPGRKAYCTEEPYIRENGTE